MRTMTRAVALATLLAFVPATNAHSQARAAAKPAASSSEGGFGLGYTDIGPVIGIGGLSYGAGIAFGGRFEHAIKDLPDMGKGVLGIQVGATYYSASQSVPGYSINYTTIPIGVTANYHFHLDEKTWDPFVGLGLGYEIRSCSYSSSFTGSGSCSYNSAIYFIGRAGVRYFMNPKLALYADVGAGAGTLNLGAMFKIGGK